MTELSRRAVLQAGTLAAAVLPFASMASAAAATSTSLYARSRFAPLVNGSFTLSDGTHSWKVTLTQVGDVMGARSSDENRFTLAFRAASGGLAQRTYTLRRAGFTATPLFVVPRGGSSLMFDVVVNRV